MTAVDIDREAAEAAGLRYVDDSGPGITRTRVRDGFAYFAPDGAKIIDATELERVAALAVPPAYEDVWISPSPHGHVQATARDAKGRKQYRYHKRWREVRDATKYEATLAFGAALPTLRERVERDLRATKLTREHVIAAVVRTLDATHIRIGNETYARDNDSFGLTTLRDRHVKVTTAGKVRMKFRGKSGVEHAIDFSDTRVARVIAKCHDLPGEKLFGFVDEHGVAHAIESADVNAYLRETMRGDFTAKDFRTFAASVICARELEDARRATTVKDAKAAIKAAIAITATELGNTPTVCKKSYVHPAIVETFLDEFSLSLPHVRESQGTHGLATDERRVLAFLASAGEREEHANRVALLEHSIEKAKRVAEPTGAKASKKRSGPTYASPKR